MPNFMVRLFRVDFSAYGGLFPAIPGSKGIRILQRKDKSPVQA